MKKFAIFLPLADQAQIVEGTSATVVRKPDGLKVVITVAPKSKKNFNGVIIFCEVSEQIKVL
jgi:hypothetical protein